MLRNYDDLIQQVLSLSPPKKIKAFFLTPIQWHQRYMLAAVYPLDGQKPSFELCFEPYDESTYPHISVDAVDGILRNLRIYG